jgi:hypothetical protein
VAANTGWTWSLASLARGGIVDVHFATPPDAGLPALLVLAAAAAAAVLWATRGPPAAASRSAVD